MAIDPQKSDSPDTRDILVTDIEWRFVFGERDGLTLREGDTVDTESQPGWILITLQHEDGFPELVKHQICQIISERHQMRVMKVPVAPATPVPPWNVVRDNPVAAWAEAAVSAGVLAVREPPDSVTSRLVAEADRQPAARPPTPRVPRSPRPRRRKEVQPDLPMTGE